MHFIFYYREKENLSRGLAGARGGVLRAAGIASPPMMEHPPATDASKAALRTT